MLAWLGFGNRAATHPGGAGPLLQLTDRARRQAPGTVTLSSDTPAASLRYPCSHLLTLRPRGDAVSVSLSDQRKSSSTGTNNHLIL